MDMKQPADGLKFYSEPNCPLTIAECDEHSRGLKGAAAIVDLVRHYVESKHLIEFVSVYPGISEVIANFELEPVEVDTKRVSAALYAAFSQISDAQRAIDEAGVRQACGVCTYTPDT